MRLEGEEDTDPTVSERERRARMTGVVGRPKRSASCAGSGPWADFAGWAAAGASLAGWVPLFLNRGHIVFAKEI